MDARSKEALVRDGFVVLRCELPPAQLPSVRLPVRPIGSAHPCAACGHPAAAVVPPEQCEAARRAVNSSIGAAYHTAVRPLRPHELEEVGEDPRARLTAAAASAPAVVDLLNATKARLAVEDALGCAIPDAATAQVALLFPNSAINLSNPTPQTADTIGQAGYPNRDIPYFGWSGHLDGLWSGGTPPPQSPEDVDPAAWYRDPGTNGAPMWADETRRISVRNFTCLVGIPLSDQSQEGCGNLGLLPGGCHVYEELFRRQRDAGSVLGPEGLDWPREDTSAPNAHGLNYMPDYIRERCRGTRSADGKNWPEPQLVIKVVPGDAVVVLHSCPHGASMNMAADPRMMIYFRITSPLRVPADGAGAGLACSADALCDIWHEWGGLQEQVAAHRAQQQQQQQDQVRKRFFCAILY